MPLPTPDCHAPTDACCRGFHDCAKHILDEMLAAVNACLCDTCDKLNAYVTTGTEGDGIVDALTVAITSARPIAATTRGKILMTRLTLDIRLRESGWPTVSDVGGEITMPPPEEQNRLALHVYGHLESMYRRLVEMWRDPRKTLVPTGIVLNQADLGDGLVPLAPSGGVVGGYITLHLDIA